MVLGSLGCLVAMFRSLSIQGAVVPPERFGTAQCLVGHGGLAHGHLEFEGRGQAWA